jgi:hypothetical protein
MSVFFTRRGKAAGLVATISFTIAGTSYQAEEGMTWAEWVSSSYNTDGYTYNGIEIIHPSGSGAVADETTSNWYVDENAEIVDGSAYLISG